MSKRTQMALSYLIDANARLTKALAAGNELDVANALKQIEFWAAETRRDMREDRAAKHEAAVIEVSL